MLVGDHCQDELFEIPAMILVVTICYLDRPEIVVVGFILAMDTECGGICMEEMGAKCHLLHDPDDDPVEEVCGSIVVYPVKCAENGVIGEMVGCDSRSE